MTEPVILSFSEFSVQFKILEGDREGQGTLFVYNIEELVV